MLIIYIGTQAFTSIWSAFHSVAQNHLCKEHALQALGFFLLLQNGTSNIPAFYCWTQFLIDKIPINKYEDKALFFSIEIYLITSLIIRAVY